MKESLPNNPTAELIRSLPTLPKERLITLWNENFGRPAGRIRPELMLPLLAFRIREKAYGGLSPEVRDQLRQITNSLTPKNRSHNEARQRFKPGTRLVREWKGQTHEVILTADGYDYQGKSTRAYHPSSATSQGTHWSGPAFFGTAKCSK